MERWESYGYPLGELDEIHSNIIPLRGVPYQLNIIESKQNLHTKYMGIKFKMTRVVEEPLAPTPS